MSGLFAFASWSRLQGSNDDYWTDRVSHLWTVGLLVFFALLVSSAQYVGDPIQCWCPAYFTGPYVGYTKSVCWISNTYYVPDDEVIPVNIKERQHREISYYQWVPFIFLFQAFLFKLPNILWRMLNNSGGVNLGRLVQLADNMQLCKPEEREKLTYQVASFLDTWLKSHQQYHFNLVARVRQKMGNIFCFCLGKRQGKFLIGFYLFIKLLYAGNALFNFFILNVFLSMNFTVYGFEVLDKLLREGEFTNSPRFPQVTLCDFEIRQLGNLQRYTVQCVLPINLFSEKLFIVLWFWYLLVATVSCFSYISWLLHTLFTSNRFRYVKKYLTIRECITTEEDAKKAKKFADSYLKDDGVFVLHVVAKNSSDLVITDLLACLWKKYKDSILLVQPEEVSREESKSVGKK